MDEIPLETMPGELAFRDSTRADQFVYQLYADLAIGTTYRWNRYGGALPDCLTDLGVASPKGISPSINAYINATVNPEAGGIPDANWAEAYIVIRRANMIIKNIEYLEASAARKAGLVAEAKLMKAQLHFEMWKRYGGIPIVDDLVDFTESPNKPRNTFEECVNYIVNICDEVVNDLPTRREVNQYGRFTSGSALGLKAKTLLYAASPLYNEKPLPGTNNLHRFEQPDKERWKHAADAALAVINLRNPDGSKAHELFSSFQRLFFTKENNYEGVIMKTFNYTNDFEALNAPAGYDGANGRTSLTLEYINMFELLSGKLPEEDPDYDDQRPYENRCVRFHSSVLYNGAELWGRSVETYTGGRDCAVKETDKGCQTGFTLFKIMDPGVRLTTPVRQSFHDFPVLRLADVMLIYAECMNEYLGIDDQDMVNDNMIYQCVNDIRARAELPAVSNLTKGEMRKLIRRERTVELSFEESRYHDLKRWREAEIVLNRPVHKVIINRVGDNFEYVYEENGQPIVAENRTFPMRMYYLPIPRSERDKNKALEQNPGWW